MAPFDRPTSVLESGTNCTVSVFACSVREQAANAIIMTADSILLICISYPTKPARPRI
jgi:hypothetical protein